MIKICVENRVPLIFHSVHVANICWTEAPLNKVYYTL